MNKELLIIMAAIALGASSARAASTPEYEVFSEYWPQRVEMTEALQLDNGTQLKAGQGFILIRVQDGKLLADFGHKGLQYIDPGLTDFKVQYARNRHERTWDNPGNTTSVLGRTCFMPDTMRQCQPDQLDPYDFVLLVYVDVGAEGTAEIIDSVNAISNRVEMPQAQTAVVIIPLDETKEELKEDLAKSEISQPVMFQFLAEGYRISFDHHPEKTPAVLLDKNGRVLKSFRLEEVLDKPTFVSKVYAAEQAQRAERSAPQRESM
ncbi:MAG: hypothetical protein ACQKBW_10565 [Puniceicoccales bacterium]